jgi:hypothetical protein
MYKVTPALSNMRQIMGVKVKGSKAACLTYHFHESSVEPPEILTER